MVMLENPIEAASGVSSTAAVPRHEEAAALRRRGEGGSSLEEHVMKASIAPH